MSEDREKIPEPIKRLARQRCGFGCVFCGSPIYEYDHLVPFSEVQVHHAGNLVLLCPTHHSEKTRGLMPVEDVVAASLKPRNLDSGVSAPHLLRYSGTDCESVVGSNRHVWPSLSDGQSTIPLLIDDTPIVAFRVEDGHLLATVQLFDADNELLVQVVDNELVYSAEPWDVEFVGTKLTVRHGAGDIFVRISFEPPSRIVIDRAHIWRNGIELQLWPDRTVLVEGNNVIKGMLAVRCTVGLGVGDTPPIGGAVAISANRAPYGPASTDHRVLVIKVPADEDPD